MKWLAHLFITILVTAIALLLLTFVFIWSTENWSFAIASIQELFPDLIRQPILYSWGIPVYGGIRLVNYFRKSYSEKGMKVMMRRVIYFLLLPGLVLFTSFKLLNHYKYADDYQWSWNDRILNNTNNVHNRFLRDGKIRGIHLFSRSRNIESTVEELVSNNVEWVSIVPYGYQRDHRTTDIRKGRRAEYDTGWSRRDSSFIRVDSVVASKGLYTVMKPHLWMSNAGSEEWRSAIDFDTEEEWIEWEKNYWEFIMHYAGMATEFNMEMLCIGVELHSTIKERPDFWKELIRDIRMVYPGKLTYAANWYEEYKNVDFWNELDYIGIQAYFPIVSINNPNLESLNAGWATHLKELQNFSKKWNKPILFTEIGYRNTEDAAIKPWEWPESISNLLIKTSVETQYNCYESFFESCWSQKWFAGALFWQWQSSSRRGAPARVITFSPQGKPAQQSMAKWFGDSD